MTKNFNRLLRRMAAAMLTAALLTLAPAVTLTAYAAENDAVQTECYMDGSTLVLKGDLAKTSETGAIVLPAGASAYSIEKIRVDDAGAVFPENAYGMFKGFLNVTNISLRGADASKVKNMSLMFANCDELTKVDLSGLSVSAEDMSGMFLQCSRLVTVYAGSGWNADNAEGEDMFKDCSLLVGGADTVFDSWYTDSTYARIDGGTDAPGYFTGKYEVKIDDTIINGTVEANYQSALPNDTVTLTVTPDDDYVINSVSVNGEELVPKYGTYLFDMPACDVTVTASFGFADGVGARLAGHTLSLDGDIGVNFYMELAPEIAESGTAYMLFTIPNGGDSFTEKVYVNEQPDATLPHAEKKGEYYVFKCNVAAKEMDSAIYAQINDGEPVGTRYEYSVGQYADYLLGNAKEDGTEEQKEYFRAKPLVEKMLQYGACAKEYFAKTSAIDPLGDVTIDEKFASFENLLPDDYFAGSTLSLKSQTTLSLYFNDTEELTFTCTDENDKIRTVETVQNDSYQVARIRNIAAGELQNSFTLTIKKGETKIGNITYSPMNYCYKVLHGGTTDARLQNVVKALAAYSEAAKLYFGS